MRLNKNYIYSILTYGSDRKYDVSPVEVAVKLNGVNVQMVGVITRTRGLGKRANYEVST